MKRNKKIIPVGIITFLLFSLASVVFVRGVLYYPNGEIRSALAESGSMPVRLVIPSIELEAGVVPVGIAYSGRMASPKNFTDVGWYKYGTLPGEAGSAVMAGHVDNGFAWPAVFANLKNVEVGDEVFVDSSDGNDDGERIRFVVKSLKVYDYDKIVEEVFYQDDASYLKLITCTGAWMVEERTHDKRLVVIAVRSDL